MKKKSLKIASVCALAGVMAIGGVMAYFTDADTATNTFTVGKVEIDLQEPNWDPEDVTQITPEEEFAKDPQVKNTGVNDAYVFLKVTVPCAEVVTANEDGTKNPLAKTQLFTYDVNEDWVLVESDTSNAATNSYVYAYVGDDNATMEAVAKGETTEALFSHVRFANVVEDQSLEGTNLNIVVDSYAIQTQNINDGDATIDGNNVDGVTAPAAVWNVVKTQAPDTAKGAENTKTDVVQ